MVERGAKTFTPVELSVVIAIIIVSAAPLPALRRGAEESKRLICLSNLRALMACWSMYADENDGKIVSGNTSLGPFNRDGACWVYWPGPFAPMKQKYEPIREGLLFSYCMSEKIYRCPAGEPDEVITYAIVVSMNGYDKIPGAPDVIKTRAQIEKPAGRVVFVDEGRFSAASWTVFYDQERWWDQIAARHGEGANLAFADGHGEYWRWRDERTLDVCQADYDLWHATLRFSPIAVQPGNEDLHKVQKAVWGRLG